MSDKVNVLVEIPKGSRNKYEYDEELGRMKLDRMLFSSVHYPTDYGFILDTLSDDGDPLDAMVIVGEATYPGVVIEAKPIALFKMRDEKGTDWKVLCVPVADPQWNWLNNLEDVPAHLLREIEHFFAVYKDLEEKTTIIDGWSDGITAHQVIEKSRKAYQDQLAISS